MLDLTRELYNALLEQRREAFRRRGARITSKDQYAEITMLRSRGLKPMLRKAFTTNT